jgi:hypothetical protein
MTRSIDADTGEALTFDPRLPVCLNSLSNPSWWDSDDRTAQREAMRNEQTSREASGIVALLRQATS